MAVTVRTDEELQQDILAELEWDQRVQPNEVGVIVKDGIVTLTGQVDSYFKRWAAEDAAKRVRGVKAIVNQIDVRIPSAAERSDQDLAAAVIRTLEWDATIPSENIRVTVSKGWVTLEGEVDWHFQKDDAEHVVRRVSGVRGVTNLIRVRTHPQPTDIKQRIERALVRSAELDASRISVETVDGKVTLRGTVDSWAEREEAERAAWMAPGVTQVDNRIVVSP